MKKNNYLLSLLWVFLTVNYIFCDVFSLYHSKFLNELLTGTIDGIEFTESFLLGFSIIMEIPMLMIILSVLLKAKTNQIINIIAAIFMIIIQVGSLSTGKNSQHYIFFSSIEIGALLFIIYKSWVWYTQTQSSIKKS
ncbi:DUF6326 family protein [Polaribacter sp. R77954]|uniref:DUF6326 family protein n=1 Tax=Polaribacter sp. R77954 TaxID=3093870 RepID=UPI0037CB32A6